MAKRGRPRKDEKLLSSSGATQRTWEENQAEIVPVLQGYMAEAKSSREAGHNPRDMKWKENVDLYWNRFDFGDREDWQAKEVLPEVPAFVDRFAAALKEALVASPTGFYTVISPDQSSELIQLNQMIKRVTDVWLGMCGQNVVGTCLPFEAVFEEQCKMGAIKAMCSVTRWKNDKAYGRVSIETVDPSNVWLDATFRNLYRIRRVELDKHQLRDMATSRTNTGNSVWNLEAVDRMTAAIAEEELRRREEMSGSDMSAKMSTRVPVYMDEYLATVVAPDGTVLAKDALMVVGNDRWLLRGPEDNPFWHKDDWMTYAPLVTVPLSPYGRSYMEDFGSVARTFNTMTNMILDAVQTSSMKVFAIVPAMLANPEDAESGVWPNKTFMLGDGTGRPQDFMHSIDMGQLAPEAFQVWQTLKNELREAADINEIGMGQFAPKGRTSATEVTQTQESSSALIRSVAQTIETRWLGPTLDLVWKTGLQHVRPNDPQIRRAIGEDYFDAFVQIRKDLIRQPNMFRATGISWVIQKNRMLRALLQLVEILSKSPELLMAFMQQVSMDKFLKYLLYLSDIDIKNIAPTKREQMIAQFENQMSNTFAQAQSGVPGGQPSSAAQNMAGQAVAAMGMQRGGGGQNGPSRR